MRVICNSISTAEVDHFAATKAMGVLMLQHLTSISTFTLLCRSLAGNPVVISENPISLAHIGLSGTKCAQTQTAPSAPVMPAFAWSVSDSHAADVLSFIRSSWGKSAVAVTPDDIAGQRKSAIPVQGPAPPATAD